MGYGKLTIRQRNTLALHVRGQIVHDLGAGDLELSNVLLELGAKRVHAVDKLEKSYYAKKLPRGLSYKSSYFHDLPASKMDVVFLSWPINHDVNLIPHVLRAGKIIYLGCNTGGSMCGTPDLFTVLVRRELLAYRPDKKNSLVIAGAYLDCPRKPTGEELAGINIQTHYYSFENAEACARGENREGETRYPV